MNSPQLSQPGSCRGAPALGASTFQQVQVYAEDIRDFSGVSTLEMALPSPEQALTYLQWSSKAAIHALALTSCNLAHLKHRLAWTGSQHRPWPSPVSRPGGDPQGQPGKPAPAPGRIQLQLRHLTTQILVLVALMQALIATLDSLSYPRPIAGSARQNLAPASLLTDRWRLSNVS